MYAERTSIIPGAATWWSTSSGEPALILPDGCIDVILMEERLMVAGPDTRARLHRGSAGATAVGLRFAPGQAPGALRVVAEELTDRTVELSAILGDPLATELFERSAEHGVVALERAFAGRVEPDPLRQLVAVGLGAGDSVEAVAGRAGLSSRQLHRRSLAWFGYGPKHLAKVLRFQRAVAAARDGAGLAGVAAETGYADQAHLARDVKALTGTTMSALLAA